VTVSASRKVRHAEFGHTICSRRRRGFAGRTAGRRIASRIASLTAPSASGDEPVLLAGINSRHQ